MQDDDLVGSDYKVLFFLCENMDFNQNTVNLRQKTLATALHMDKGNVSKSIKKLREKQFITKVDNGFMINPHLFYVGAKTRMDRENLRESFDKILEADGIDPRFYLNEDEYRLEDEENDEFLF